MGCSIANKTPETERNYYVEVPHIKSILGPAQMVHYFVVFQEVLALCEHYLKSLRLDAHPNYDVEYVDTYVL